MKKIFPKYHKLICDTYTPDFTASGTPCTLQTGSGYTKSRLLKGGTFFRSIQTGATSNVNNIHLTCVVTDVTVIGSPPTNIITENVDFTITDVLGQVTTLPTFQQAIFTGSPIACVENGFDNLRTKMGLSGQSVIEIPNSDADGSGWIIADEEECMLTSFDFDMGGAVVLDNGSSTMRTGPAFTLFYISTMETTATGGITTVDTISEWDDVQWLPHPSTLYAAGSGSPALCNP